MVGPSIEAEPHDFELPLGADFESYCLNQFRRIRSVDHRDVPNIGFDPETGLYADEKTAIDSLISRCTEYMGELDLTLVKNAQALMLLAHATQYRDSGEPYSTHCLASALELANKPYQQDGPQIASELLHDTEEDTQITEQIIRKYFPPEVAITVEGNTKHRSRHMRKSVADEKTRFKTAFSIVDNPRVIIDKLADRLHNMRTLGDKHNKQSRYNTILETQQIYIPLAKRLGLFDIAEEMDYLCIYHDDRKDQNRLELLVEEHEVLSKKFQEQEVIKQISSILVVELEIHARLASVAAAYRDPGSKFHINVDITFGYDMELDKWGRSMMDLADIFVWGNPEYEVAEMPSAATFRNDLREGKTDSLGFWVSPGYLGVPYHIHMYPQYVYELEMSKITDLYYTSNVPDTGIEKRRILAQEKQRVLAVKLSQSINPTTEREKLSVQSFVSLMEPRGMENDMIIIEHDGEESTSFYKVQKGATVLDYLRFKRMFDWAKADQVFINGNDATFGTELHEGDRIKIVNGAFAGWDPSWIFDFAIDSGGPEEVRKNIIRILRKSDSDTRDRLYKRIYKVGKERLEQLFPAEEQPYRYGLQSELLRGDLTVAALAVEIFIYQNNLIDVLSEMNIGGPRDNIEEYFRIGVGLGILNQSVIDNIMDKAREINKQVMVMDVSFNADIKGQIAILTDLAVRRDISLVGNVETDPYGKRVVCHLYVKPEDKDKLPMLLKDIQKNRKLRRKSLDSVNYHSAIEANVYFS